MTVWQISIVVCLYLLIGSIIGYVITERDDEEVMVYILFWPCIVVVILVAWILLSFGKLGKFIVITSKAGIDLIKNIFNKKGKK